MPPRTSKIFKGCFCIINNSSPSLIPIFWAQPSLDTFRIHTCDAGGQGSICSPKSPSSQQTVKKPSSTCPSFLIFKSSTSDTTFVPSTSLLFFWDLYRSCAFFFLQFAWSFVEETASVSAFKAGRKIKWSGRRSNASWNRIHLAGIDKQIHHLLTEITKQQDPPRKGKKNYRQWDMLIYQTGSTLSLFVFTLFGQQDDANINENQSTLPPERVKRLEKRNLKNPKIQSWFLWPHLFQVIHLLQFARKHRFCRLLQLFPTHLHHWDLLYLLQPITWSRF